LKRLLSHFLRLDPRSLGAFRVVMAAALIADLFGRWEWIGAFYTNEGVIPNHNHLFILLERTELWSALHAVSSEGEAHFAFAVILFFYLGFLFGIQTRVFHVLSLIALVSLTGRNLLLENAGNYLAIAILALTVLLPLGSGLSFDFLKASFSARDEKTAQALNEVEPRSDDAYDARRKRHDAGYSPISLAALGVLVLLSSVYLITAYRQGPDWQNGVALERAIYWQPWASDLAVWLRGRAEAVLRVLTYLVYGAQWLIPVLIFTPVLRGWCRSLAFLLAAAHALVLGSLFDFGLYAPTLFACSFLLISPEVWELYAKRRRPDRACTVIYDADCGFCLWTCRLLKRLDVHRHLTFQGNDDLGALLVREGDAVTRAKRPKAVTDELAATSVIVVDAERNVLTRGRAVAAVVGALPGGAAAAAIMRLPVIRTLLDLVYDEVAERRIAISVALGWDACGTTPPSDDSPPPAASPSPARMLAYRSTAAVREIAAVVVVSMLAIQISRNNDLPDSSRLPEIEPLRALATYGRIVGRWDVLTPGVPDEQGGLVVDAQTRSGLNVDLMTGGKPHFAVLEAPRKGQLWASFAANLQKEEFEPFQKAFRDYLVRQGGPGYDPEGPIEQRVSGFDLYWVAAPIGPDAADPNLVQPRRILRHSRGGLIGVPTPRPPARLFPGSPTRP
jgi:predicted DCC family thiol-disulfide oxidoreductase YuxK